MAGLPASGKSALSARLKKALKAVLLDKDHVRASLFAEYVDYSRAQDDLCVDIMYDLTAYHLEQRPTTPIILDGRTYSRRYQIDALKRAAARSKTTIHIIECVCSEETALTRLEQDKDKHVAQDRDAQLYRKSRAAADPITEERLVLDTDAYSVGQCEQAALAYLREKHTC